MVWRIIKQYRGTGRKFINKMVNEAITDKVVFRRPAKSEGVRHSDVEGVKEKMF